MSRIFKAPPSYIPPPPSYIPPPPSKSGVIITAVGAPLSVTTSSSVQPGVIISGAGATKSSVQRSAPPVGSRLLIQTKNARVKREEKLASMLPDQRERFLAREKARQEALEQYRNLVLYKRHHNKVK